MVIQNGVSGSVRKFAGMVLFLASLTYAGYFAYWALFFRRPSVYFLPFAHFSSLLITVLVMLFFLTCFRRDLVAQSQSIKSSLIARVAWGIIAGLAIACLALTVDRAPSASLRFGIVSAFFSVIVLPIGSEFVFRRVVLGQLLRQAPPYLAVLASVGLFYLLWPWLDPIPRVVFGFTSAVLYWRSGSLISSPVAHITLASVICFQSQIPRIV